MAERILVPIDFRVASLNTLKLALEKYEGQKVVAVLLFAEYLDISISDLLFYSPTKKVTQYYTTEFKEALEILKNRFADRLVANISVELLHGNNTNAMQNFIEGNQINKVFVPQTYRLKTTRNSFNPLPLLKKVKVDVVPLAWDLPDRLSEREQLLDLFN